MAASVGTPSPTHITKDPKRLMSSSPLVSPTSDKRFWSNLRSRVDTILENRKCEEIPNVEILGNSDRADQFKEDSLLLLRGFDSISDSLSLLSNNIDRALQGARDLGKPPTLTEILHVHMKNTESRQNILEKIVNEGESKKGLKRRFDHEESSEIEENEPTKENQQIPKNMRIAKNLAVSMATKAACMAKELKSIKSDLCFMQDRCDLLEEENRRLRHGCSSETAPEEDDLVRLQLEALLAEKSRLASENANLIRENQCLHQLVEYHQVTSEDLSASYEDVIGGICLDFSSSDDELNNANDE